MVVDVKENPLDTRFCALSFDPWMESYPTPAFLADVPEWWTWLANVLINEVSVKGLKLFIKTLAIMLKSPSTSKFVWTHLKLLRHLIEHSGPGT